ncbi:MAG: hypothetical protein KDA37_05235 [Planctomycetales bacterium]|nr:hypothetical protein [Planctomycetales bacterium]
MATTTRKIGAGVQQLEEKAMMTGDVEVIVQGNVLQFIEEDVNQSQQVMVTQYNNNFVRVQGLGDTDIRYDGQLWDSIILHRSSFSGGIFAQLGGGNDTFVFSGGGFSTQNVNVSTGSGYDNVTITGLNTTGEVKIDTGSQNDNVYVSNLWVAGAGNDLRILTGSGLDTVTVNNVAVEDDIVVQTYASSTENERDVVTIRDSNFDDFYGYFGGGNDKLRMEDNGAANDRLDNVYAFLGDGNDEAEYFGNTADYISTNGGAGNDDVEAGFNDVDYFNFAGDSGYDEYFEVQQNGKDSNSFGQLKLSSAYHRFN